MPIIICVIVIYIMMGPCFREHERVQLYCPTRWIIVFGPSGSSLKHKHTYTPQNNTLTV